MACCLVLVVACALPAVHANERRDVAASLSRRFGARACSVGRVLAKAVDDFQHILPYGLLSVGVMRALDNDEVTSLATRTASPDTLRLVAQLESRKWKEALEQKRSWNTASEALSSSLAKLSAAFGTLVSSDMRFAILMQHHQRLHPTLAAAQTPFTPTLEQKTVFDLLSDYSRNYDHHTITDSTLCAPTNVNDAAPSGKGTARSTQSSAQPGKPAGAQTGLERTPSGRASSGGGSGGAALAWSASDIDDKGDATAAQSSGNRSGDRASDDTPGPAAKRTLTLPSDPSPDAAKTESAADKDEADKDEAAAEKRRQRSQARHAAWNAQADKQRDKDQQQQDKWQREEEAARAARDAAFPFPLPGCANPAWSLLGDLGHDSIALWPSGLRFGATRSEVDQHPTSNHDDHAVSPQVDSYTSNLLQWAKVYLDGGTAQPAVNASP
jgi:hypothetical protein